MHNKWFQPNSLHVICVYVYVFVLWQLQITIYNTKWFDELVVSLLLINATKFEEVLLKKLDNRQETNHKRYVRHRVSQTFHSVLILNELVTCIYNMLLIDFVNIKSK